MDDYSALAQRIAVSVSGVRGSLILSRDGLVLGAFPAGDEGHAKTAWLRFVTLGEPEKSFVEFPDQVWAFVKRGPYAAFSVAEPGTRPGVLVDQMEQVLLAAEDGRTKRDPVRLPDAAAAPSGKPRTSLHPPAGKPEPAEAPVAADPLLADTVSSEAIDRPPERDSHWRRAADAAVTAAGDGPLAASEVPQPPELGSGLKKEPQKLASAATGGGGNDEVEVDRVLLAKEFSGLLQVDSADDEESS
jgi:hypothetical protein